MPIVSRRHLKWVGMLLLVCTAKVMAEEPLSSAASPSAPTTRPVLDALNRETQALFREARTGVVRVQLPAPKWLNAYTADSMNRWEQQHRRGHGGDASDSHDKRGATGRSPSAQSPAKESDGSDQGTIIFVRPPAGNSEPQRDPIVGGKLQTDTKTVVSFQPNNVGMILDDAGHVLVPLYVERETCAAVPARVALSDGRVIEARFIGSDRQTNLTLLQVMPTPGMPVRLASKKPDEGSLVLYLSPTDASGRLALWTGGAHEFGIVFCTDGRAAGIARYGQFLSGSACKLIADQIIRYGSVKRATLGVIISEIPKDDPLRERSPMLGGRTAMRIDEVIGGSTADKAGLKAGDLLLALAGESVSDIPSFAAAIAARTGDTELLILRGEETHRIKVNLQPK
jgi:hypothetical protein